MKNTQEFKNLVDLLESPIKDNVVLGLLIARNYEEAFSDYFGCKIEEMEDLIDFLVENNAWRAGTPLLEIHELVLNNKNLQKFPIAIRILKKLAVLNFLDNELQSIPKEIGELKNLSALYLHHNQLESIPQEIGELRNLTYLYLQQNQLQHLPAQIENLTNLKNLDISDNKIPVEELENLKKILPDCQIIT